MITTLINREFKQEKYNILLILSQDLIFDYMLCQLDHNFYCSEKWFGRDRFGQTIDKPDNLQFFINEPINLDYSLIITYGRLDAFSLAEQIGHHYHLPILCINNQAVNGIDRTQHWEVVKNRTGAATVYTSKNILNSWLNQSGMVIPPPVPEFFNKENRTDKVDCTMLLPTSKQDEEMGRILSKEFIVEYLWGRNLEDLSIQLKNSRVFVDLQGPNFQTANLLALASGCQLVSVKRVENDEYCNNNRKLSNLGEFVQEIKDRLEKPQENNFVFNTVENFQKDMNFIIDKVANQIYER